MIDLETQAAAELEPGVREKLAYATENIVPLLARISPAGMQDATADIVADRVKLKKNYLNEANKDETQRQKAAVFEALLRQAEPAAEE